MTPTTTAPEIQTPETDAASHEISSLKIPCVSADFARTLERRAIAAEAKCAASRVCCERLREALAAEDYADKCARAENPPANLFSIQQEARALRKAAIALTLETAASELAELALLREDNKEFRVMLYVANTQMRGYHDDGELQDGLARPFIDWKRDSAKAIQEKLLARNLEAARQVKETT